MVGDNSLIPILRNLTSIELFTNAHFYSQHPLFSSIVEKHSEFENSLKNLLLCSVSQECLDSGLMTEELVKKEALLNCHDKKWSSFLCILGLSSVIGKNIQTYYPDSGEIRHKLMFNALINPRNPVKLCSDVPVHILFCHEGIVKPGEKFHPNHFVPLVFYSSKFKRKCLSATSAVSAKKPKFGKNTDGDISKFFSKEEKPAVSVCTETRAANVSLSSKAEVIASISISDTATTSNIPVISKPQQPPEHSLGCIELLDDQVKTSFPVSNSDVASYRQKVKGLNTPDICNLIKNVFRPHRSYVFPRLSEKNKRSFKYEWLDLFPWLCYSVSEDGAYCLSCVLFGDCFPRKTPRITRLFSKPFRYWNDAMATFKQHAGNNTGGEMGLHACTFPMLTALLSQMSSVTQPIENIMDANVKKEIMENRKILRPIVDSVLFCGRLGIGLRGHRDDSKYHPQVGCYSTDGNVGNFVESLNFRVRAGDDTLKTHLSDCGKNKSYVSKTSQNKIIKCIGEVISESLIKEIKESMYYSIIADEAADSSHKEQLSLVLRFVDNSLNIREEFMCFLHCKWGLSDQNLAKLILEALDDFTLPIDNCRGQGYDGAGAGHINGLAAHILKVNPKALYTHCYSHRLNLSVCDTLSILEVTKMLKHVGQAANFINISQTRNMPFADHIKDSELNTKKTKLVSLCKTRWVERVQSLDTFQELFIPLIDTLQDMVNGESRAKPSLSADASSLLTLITQFDFIVALVITRHVLDATLPVTQLLQGKSIDVMDGFHLITTLKNDVTNMRTNIDFYHDTWYDEALELAKEVNIQEAKKRTVGKQTTRSNPPSSSFSEHYKLTITIPLLDHLQAALGARFDLDSLNVYKGLSIVPVKMMSLYKNGIDWKEYFKTVTTFYHKDLPNPLALDAELRQWFIYWDTHNGPLPDNVIKTLKSVSFNGFENIKVILRILGTLPITSCECERSISALRNLKNYKRSTMVEERLNGLALMGIHTEVVPDVEKIIDKFAQGNTRLKFL